MDNCIFCKIIKGEIPAYKVYEDEDALAFLDIHPVKEGHTLVIPKKHDSYLFEMEDSDYSSLMNSSKKVAGILKKAFNPRTGKIGMIVYGLDVDHIHLHLIPIDQSGDLNLGKSTTVSLEQLAATIDKIKSV